MTKREVFSLIILVLVIGFAAYKYFNRTFTATKTRFLLDTIVDISASSKSKTVSKEVDSVFVFIERMESKLDEYDSGSWVSKFNALESGYFPMDEDVYELLTISDSLYTISGGSFDITIKPVFDLWGFGSKTPEISDSLTQAPPDSLLIKEKLSLVSFPKLRYDRKRIYKPAGMQISLGSIAKGYILDKAREYMQGLNLDKGYISCRSSMTLFGSDTPQVILIQDPRNPNREIASFKLSNSSLGTSGDYQQYFEYQGKRYHHILNAKTGTPVPAVYSVTVIHPSAAWADGLSTALFTMDPLKAIELVKTMPNANAVIYCTQDGSISSIKTKGMQELGFSERL